MPILQSLESMERISRQALAADLDAVLERVSRENIGLVITDEWKDDLVLCPASWSDMPDVTTACSMKRRCRWPWPIWSGNWKNRWSLSRSRRSGKNFWSCFSSGLLSSGRKIQMEMKNPMDEKKYEIVEIQVDADVLEELKTVIAPLGLTPEMLIVRFFEFCTDPATQEEAVSLLLKWKAELEAESYEPRGDF